MIAAWLRRLFGGATAGRPRRRAQRLAAAVAPDVAPAEEAETDGEVVGDVNRRELAMLLGVSAPTVTELVRAGMPVRHHGKSGQSYRFDFEACRDWYAAHLEGERAAKRQRDEKVQQLLDLQGGGGALDAVPIADRKAYLEAERLRMALAVQRRQYVPTERVRRDYEAVFGLLSEALQSLPDLLERECNLPATSTAVVIRVVDEFQNALVERIDALPTPLDDEAEAAVLDDEVDLISLATAGGQRVEGARHVA